jgi:hypothetical protein
MTYNLLYKLTLVKIKCLGDNTYKRRKMIPINQTLNLDYSLVRRY